MSEIHYSRYPTQSSLLPLVLWSRFGFCPTDSDVRNSRNAQRVRWICVIRTKHRRGRFYSKEIFPVHAEIPRVSLSLEKVFTREIPTNREIPPGGASVSIWRQEPLTFQSVGAAFDATLIIILSSPSINYCITGPLKDSTVRDGGRTKVGRKNERKKRIGKTKKQQPS